MYKVLTPTPLRTNAFILVLLCVVLSLNSYGLVIFVGAKFLNHKLFIECSFESFCNFTKFMREYNCCNYLFSQHITYIDDIGLKQCSGRPGKSGESPEPPTSVALFLMHCF
jgi:hypothetical protein